MADYILSTINKNSCTINNSSSENNSPWTFMNSTDSRKLLKTMLSEEDYSRVKSMWGDTLFIPDIIPPEIDPKILEKRKEKLVEDMSNRCHEIITNGFDIQLSDGNTYHFSLKIEDQLMIQALMLEAQNDKDGSFPYHADNQICMYFNCSDITNIYLNMKNIIKFNVTYFNSLKNYISYIDNILILNNIEWGIDIPEEYQSNVLKDLLNK